MPAETQILVALRPTLVQQLFSQKHRQALSELGAVRFQPGEGRLTSSQLAEQIGAYDIVITGWGTPVFNDEVLAAAGRLKLIAHSAGTIKRMLPPAVFAEGRRVTHSAAAMAVPVSEMTLLLILLCLRKTHKMDRAFRERSWETAKTYAPGEELAGRRVGVIGAGHTGRAVIRLLRAVGAEIWLSDPYLNAEGAASLGAFKVSLERLMRECPVVTCQAPATTETYRMLGAEQFGWLRDGAIFINTSRSHLVDEAALLAELQSDRISAAIDVFDQEPLPNDSPFRALDNVILTPHAANETVQSFKRQGQIVSEEVTRFLQKGELRYEITGAMLATMA